MVLSHMYAYNGVLLWHPSLVKWTTATGLTATASASMLVIVKWWLCFDFTMHVSQSCTSLHMKILPLVKQKFDKLPFISIVCHWTFPVLWCWSLWDKDQTYFLEASLKMMLNLCFQAGISSAIACKKGNWTKVRIGKPIGLYCAQWMILTSW